MNHRRLIATAPRRHHLLAGWLVAAMAVLTSSPVSAFSAEGQGWVSGGVANLHHAAPTAAGWWGPSLQLGMTVNINDFWRIGADLGASHHFQRTIDDEPTGPHTVASAGLEARYAFDVFTYVPYVGLGAAIHPLSAPAETSPDGELASLRATVGLDYRMSREWSIGGAIQLHAPVTQPTDFPHYSTLRVHLGYHFRRF